MREGVDILMGNINSATALVISGLVQNEKSLLRDLSQDRQVLRRGKPPLRLPDYRKHRQHRQGCGYGPGHAEVREILDLRHEYGHALAEDLWKNLKKLKPEVGLLG